MTKPASKASIKANIKSNKLSKRNMNMVDALKEVEERYPEGDTSWLGLKSAITYPDHISGSRTFMLGKNIEQIPVQCNPDKAWIVTGRENALSQHSIGNKKAIGDFEIISKISKYPDIPNQVYSIIVRYLDTGKYDIIERCPVESLTESYGYSYNSDNMDEKEPTDVMEKGEVLMQSTSFDKDGNYLFGKNIPTVYLVDPILEEDGIMINEDYADQFKFWKVHNPRYVLNENDIMGNQYHNKDIMYKGFPDINEDINGYLAVIRRIDHKSSFYTMKDDLLKEVLPNDVVLNPTSGKVVDVKVFCNCDVNELQDEIHSAQINKYARLHYTYMKTIVETIDSLGIPDDLFEDDLAYYYDIYSKGIDPAFKWGNDYKTAFSHMCVEFTICEQKKMNVGSKCTGRFGDKGVIVSMRKSEDMPSVRCKVNGEFKLVPVGMCCNALGVPGRLNPIQLFTIMLTHISRQLLEYTRTECKTLGEKRKIIFKYLSIVSPFNAEPIISTYGILTKEEKVKMIREFESLEYIRVIIPPIHNKLGLDMLSKLLVAFDGIIEREFIYQKNNKGRLIKGENPVVFGNKYVLRLKHEPDTKFSARSAGFVSSTSNLPSKSNMSKQYREPFPDTPIKLGRMEWLTMFLDINGIESTRKMKAFQSDYVRSRRLPDLHISEDPFNIPNLPIIEGESNRVLEMTNAYFNGMFLHLGDITHRYDGIDPSELTIASVNKYDDQV